MKSFELSNNCVIKVYTGSIFDSKLDCEAIVISTFKKVLFKQNVGLVKLVVETFGSKVKKGFENQINKYPKNFELNGQCVSVETGNKKPKYLFCTILDFFDDKKLDDFDHMMKISLENLIKKLNENQTIESIAIPLLATGLSKGPIKNCINILIDGIIDFHKKGDIKFLKEIHLVNIEDSKTQLIIQKLQEVLVKNLPEKLKINKKKDDVIDEIKVENKQNDEKKNFDSKQCFCCKQKLKEIKLAKCGHSFCLSCLNDIKENENLCLIPDCPNYVVKTNESKTNTDDEKNDEKTCSICCNDFDSLRKLDKCGHELCEECLKNTFKNKPQCPFCFTFYGIPQGFQPSGGKMSHHIQNLSLPGYESAKTIVIDYSFGPGIQNENHPSPGKQYSGTHRTAYLPATEEGSRALNLLKKAFENKLTFTIGISVTTGIEGITWNDIHHKTQIRGPYGYPDMDYLKRLFEELKSHGIE